MPQEPRRRRGRLSAAFRPYSSLAAAGNAPDIHIWDTSSGRHIIQLNHGSPVESVEFSPDGQRLASAGYDSACIWEVSSGRKLKCLEHGNEVHSVHFSRDGAYVLTGSSDKTVRIWDAVSGKELRRMQVSSTVDEAGANLGRG